MRSIWNLYLFKKFAGKLKEIEAPIMLSTWQSLQNLERNFFYNFDTVVVDETHLATGTLYKKY